MSQINDALKRARNDAPGGLPSAIPPLQPVTRSTSSVAAGLIPSVVIILVITAVFFIGWAMAHQPAKSIVRTPVSAPTPVAAVQPVQPVTTVTTVTTVTAPASTPAAVPPPVIPKLPKLQGIFYSATAPSAIVDGKTVRPGDPFKQYRVKEITRLTVSLMDAEGKTTTLVMGN